MAKSNRKPIPTFVEEQVKPVEPVLSEDFDDLTEDTVTSESELPESQQPELSDVRNDADSNEPSPDCEEQVETAPAIEEITELPEGWLAMETAPLVGIRVHVMRTDGSSLVVFWKRTRRYVQGRWQMNGKWCNALTGKEIDFEPLYWKEM